MSLLHEPTVPGCLRFGRYRGQSGRSHCPARARVIGSGKVEIIPDVLEDPEMEMPTNSLFRIRATLGVPMLRDNKVEGVLLLTRPEPGPFTKSQIDLVQIFADQGRDRRRERPVIWGN
jgi:GAF domain-containing protein